MPRHTMGKPTPEQEARAAVIWGDKPKPTNLRQCVDCPAQFKPRGRGDRCQPCRGAHIENRSKGRKG